MTQWMKSSFLSTTHFLSSGNGSSSLQPSSCFRSHNARNDQTRAFIASGGVLRADTYPRPARGRYNIYFRHMATDQSPKDNVARAGDWTRCDPHEDAPALRQGDKDPRLANTGIRNRCLLVSSAPSTAVSGCWSMTNPMRNVFFAPNTWARVLRIAAYIGQGACLPTPSRTRPAGSALHPHRCRP